MESVTRLDVGVPQGRGRFDAEAGKMAAEKSYGVKLPSSLKGVVSSA